MNNAGLYQPILRAQVQRDKETDGLEAADGQRKGERCSAVDHDVPPCRDMKLRVIMKQYRIKVQLNNGRQFFPLWACVRYHDSGQIHFEIKTSFTGSSPRLHFSH